MNRCVFAAKGERVGSTGDRFVARRPLLRPDLDRHRELHQTPRAPLFDNIWYSKRLSKRNYVNYLDSALELTTPDQKVLNFSVKKEKKKIYSPSSSRRCSYPPTQTWPCRPRKRPCMGSADSVLDLPNYGASAWIGTDFESVDWSRSDMLLATLGNKVYVWSWQRQSLVCDALATSLATCGKFSPEDPATMAVALSSGEVETFKVETAKPLWREFCSTDHACSVTALAWSPTGKSLVIGCSQGTLTVMDASLVRLARRPRAHSTTVMRLRVSPDARYLASLGVYDTSVSVWQWPHLKPYFLFENYSIVKSLAWHPWANSMLGIGGSSVQNNDCVLAVWDVAAPRLRQPTVKCNSNLVVDCMQFSHLTGEVVLGCWMVMCDSASNETGSRVMVLSDPATEVDAWSMSDRVTTMMFSPDGTKLAVATTGEDLIILYYLPEEPKWKNRNARTDPANLCFTLDHTGAPPKKRASRDRSALAVWLDEAECGVSHR